MEYKEVFEMIEKNIEFCGQHLQAVSSEGNELAFVYTVGNYKHNLPELLLIGNFNPYEAGTILNIFGERMRREGKALDEYVQMEEGSRFVIWCRRAGPQAKKDYTLFVDNLKGDDDYEVIQVVLCDKDGRFPYDEGVDYLFKVPLV